MDGSISKLEAGRQEGKNQVDAQRVHILDAAEKLFLEKGLENTSMSDIAGGAGITRVSLYRYFSDRHQIAFELAARRMHQIISGIDLSENEKADLEKLKQAVIDLIDSFYPLRDAYRYLGMFDHLYGSEYPNSQLAGWYKNEIFSLGWGTVKTRMANSSLGAAQIGMILNSAMSFLQKMAVRGDLMAAEQEISLDEQLNSFKEMVILYIDHAADQGHYS